MRGDDIQPLVQVPVGGGIADPGVRSEGVQFGAVAQPAQHQAHLRGDRGRPLPGPGPGAGADAG